MNGGRACRPAGQSRWSCSRHRLARSSASRSSARPPRALEGPLCRPCARWGCCSFADSLCRPTRRPRRQVCSTATTRPAAHTHPQLPVAAAWPPGLAGRRVGGPTLNVAPRAGTAGGQARVSTHGSPTAWALEPAQRIVGGGGPRWLGGAVAPPVNRVSTRGGWRESSGPGPCVGRRAPPPTTPWPAASVGLRSSRLSFLTLRFS